VTIHVKNGGKKKRGTNAPVTQNSWKRTNQKKKAPSGPSVETVLVRGRRAESSGWGVGEARKGKRLNGNTTNRCGVSKRKKGPHSKEGKKHCTLRFGGLQQVTWGVWGKKITNRGRAQRGT